MIGELFGGIIGFMKSTAPMSIVFNVILGMTLLIVGIVLLRKQQQSRGRRIGGWVCASISVLAFLGAASNWLFSYIIF